VLLVLRLGLVALARQDLVLEHVCLILHLIEHTSKIVATHRRARRVTVSLGLHLVPVIVVVVACIAHLGGRELVIVSIGSHLLVIGVSVAGPIDFRL
jgi:hypothetical protein